MSDQKEGFLDIILDKVSSGMDFDFSDMDIEEKTQGTVKKEKQPVNKPEDKTGKTEICQGIVLFLGSLGVVICACVRGCQEVNKHKGIEKQSKVVQLQQQNLK